MKHLITFAAGLAALALFAGAAAAQSSGSMSSGSMSSGAMKSGAMSSSSMSKMDTKTMKSCQAMAHDAMMASKKCKSLMAKHSDMYNADGTMKSMAPQ